MFLNNTSKVIQHRERKIFYTNNAGKTIYRHKEEWSWTFADLLNIRINPSTLETKVWKLFQVQAGYRMSSKPAWATKWNVSKTKAGYAVQCKCLSSMQDALVQASKLGKKKKIKWVKIHPNLKAKPIKILGRKQTKGLKNIEFGQYFLNCIIVTGNKKTNRTSWNLNVYVYLRTLLARYNDSCH